MSTSLVSLLNKELSDQTMPQYVGVTPPITFDEPIPFIMEYNITYKEIGQNKTYEYNYLIEGEFNGYNTNNPYPYFKVNNDWNNNQIYSWDLQNMRNIQNVTGYYKYYLNGAIQQNVSINAGNMNTYNSLTRNLSMFDNFHLEIVHCTIPIIYYVAPDVSHGDIENIYYITQWETTSIAIGFDYEKCLNLKEADEPLVEYYYYGQAEQYIADEFGDVHMTDATPIYRGIKIKSRKRCSLYEIEGIDNGILKMGMNLQNVEIAYYSNDGGDTWQQIPGQPTSLPYDYLYRNWHDEVGTFYALSVNGGKVQTNMFIFENETESDTYNDGGDNDTNAVNYDDVSTDNPPSNKTGEADDATEFGVVGTRSFFSQQYILSVGALSEIANAFFDVTAGGFWEDIKKGLEMYGDSPVDDIQGLYFVPFDASSVFTDIISQNYIYFGGYKFDLQTSVNKIIYPNGYKDFGSFEIETTFGDNYRSYEPYTKLYVFLPYIGWQQLDMKRYLHKTVNVRYYFDTRTGTCTACLLANSVLVDYYQGQCFVSMPITATDFVSYANAQLQTLLGFNSKPNTGVVGEFAKGSSQGLIESGAVSASTMGVAGLAVGGAINATKTLYGLTQNNINNFNHTIGGSSSMINMLLPQEVCFMFEIQDAMPTANEQSLLGLPSNASGSIASFNGYLEVDTVNLVCADATANEKAQIVRMLQNGVYI